MKSAETTTLARTLVVGATAAALSFSVAGTASASADTTEPAGDATDNTLRITQHDYEFQVEGALTAGSVSIAVESATSLPPTSEPRAKRACGA